MKLSHCKNFVSVQGQNNHSVLYHNDYMQLTLPIASSPLSKKRTTPNIKNPRPKATQPRPISAKK